MPMIPAAEAAAHVQRSTAMQPLPPPPGSSMPGRRSALGACASLARHKKVTAGPTSSNRRSRL